MATDASASLGAIICAMWPRLLHAPAPSGKCTKSVQCKAGLMHSKDVGVDWTAIHPMQTTTKLFSLLFDRCVHKNGTQPAQLSVSSAAQRHGANDNGILCSRSTNAFKIVTQVLPAPSHVAHTCQTDTEYNQCHMTLHNITLHLPMNLARGNYHYTLRLLAQDVLLCY